jgi:hypothetical protein
VLNSAGKLVMESILETKAATVGVWWYLAILAGTLAHKQESPPWQCRAGPLWQPMARSPPWRRHTPCHSRWRGTSRSAAA